MVKRGDIWMVNLDPMATKGFPAPFRIAVTHAGNDGLILLDQLRVMLAT